MSFYQSITILAPVIRDEPSQPCNPSPCGSNSVCRERNGVGSCTCLPEYFGDPYVGCRPECIANNDCPREKACINNKCKDPCPGVCGVNAICKTLNHNPTCTCFEGYTGNALSSCREIPPPSKIDLLKLSQVQNLNKEQLILGQNEPENPCIPSPCGPNSQCRVINSHAVCSCVTGMIGAPPQCRPECVVSAECSQDRACVNQKCIDPCPGTCGANAQCKVINHNAICSCSPGFTGDPFIQCLVEKSENLTKIYSKLIFTNYLTFLEPPLYEPSGNPCIPSPCGPNSQCRVVGELPACSCLPNYIGRSPNCRPECTLNAECPSNLACINEKCQDPCVGSCGINSICTVIKHNPVCSCKNGYTGDPFSSCTEILYCKIPTFFSNSILKLDYIFL